MENLYSAISGVELVKSFGEDYEFWREMVGRSVIHRKHGHGKILKVEKRYDNPPLITIVFFTVNIEKVFNTHAFRDGYFTEVEADPKTVSAAIRKQLYERSNTDQQKRRTDECAFGQHQDTTDKSVMPAKTLFDPLQGKNCVRRTHCWKCGFDGLDSSIHYLCSICKGIVCPKCGECLCRFRTGAWF